MFLKEIFLKNVKIFKRDWRKASNRSFGQDFKRVGSCKLSAGQRTLVKILEIYEHPLVLQGIFHESSSMGIFPWFFFSQKSCLPNAARGAGMKRVIGWSPFQFIILTCYSCDTVDGRNPAPVETVGSFSEYWQGFIHPRWLAGFLPSTIWL